MHLLIDCARIALRMSLGPLTRRQAIRLIQTRSRIPCVLCSASLTPCFSLFPYSPKSPNRFTTSVQLTAVASHRYETHKPRNTARSRVFYSIRAHSTHFVGKIKSRLVQYVPESCHHNMRGFYRNNRTKESLVLFFLMNIKIKIRKYLISIERRETKIPRRKLRKKLVSFPFLLFFFFFFLSWNGRWNVLTKVGRKKLFCHQSRCDVHADVLHNFVFLLILFFQLYQRDQRLIRFGVDRKAKRTIIREIRPSVVSDRDR